MSLGRDPKTKRHEYVTTTVRGGRRTAQRVAARLIKLVSEGQISTERETLGGLLGRWLDHIEQGPRRSPRDRQELLLDRRVEGALVVAQPGLDHAAALVDDCLALACLERVER